MPVKRYEDGTGLTKRDRVRVKLSNPPTAEEVGAVIESLQGAGAVSTFEGRVQFAETWATEVLENAGLSVNGRATIQEVQTPEWYANKILSDLYTIRKIKVRVTNGKGDEADALTLLSLELGLLLYEIAFKLDWEPDTIFGIGWREMLQKAARATKDAKAQRNELIRRLADEHRAKDKTSNAWIAQQILKRAAREAETPDLELSVRKIWDGIRRLSPDTVRNGVRQGSVRHPAAVEGTATGGQRNGYTDCQ